jgi:hypothetical protein
LKIFIATSKEDIRYTKGSGKNDEQTQSYLS